MSCTEKEIHMDNNYQITFLKNFLIVDVLNFVDLMLEKGKLVILIILMFGKVLRSTASSIRKAKLTGHTHHLGKVYPTGSNDRVIFQSSPTHKGQDLTVNRDSFHPKPGLSEGKRKQRDP